jgi:predicted cupin superfamily sugar epimerase
MEHAVDAIIDLLGLRPHPEGGWYAETWRHDTGGGGRGAGSAIYFLLAAGQRSHWHRVDATEIWHHYAGGPLVLSIHAADAARSGAATRDIVLGDDLAAGQVPQAVVPADAWQAAEPTGAWTLVGCTVSPGFTFEGFELAPPGWSPR